MKGDDQVIQLLNETLKNELTAINQYWLHYRMLDNWGVKRLADYERHESIDEMKHADRSPSASSSSKACPISRCSGACGSARPSRRSCAPISSSSTRRSSSCAARSPIARRSATSSAATCSPRSSRARKSHVDFLETQFEMIERMGLQNYIQLQCKPAEE